MELELRVVSSTPSDFCSALVSLSTRLRVSLGDNSPSSPHLRLERSGGHMRGGTAFTKLWPLRCSMWQCSPKIHGRNSEECSMSIPNWFDTASSTHDPPPKASVRDAPEPCCCLQEVSVSPEETRRFMGVPIPEVRSKSHEQNSVRL